MTKQPKQLRLYLEVLALCRAPFQYQMSKYNDERFHWKSFVLCILCKNGSAIRAKHITTKTIARIPCSLKKHSLKKVEKVQ